MVYCITGERVSLLVQRTAPAIGNVTVEWRIQGPQTLLTFEESSGVLFFTEVRGKILVYSIGTPHAL